MKFYFVLFLLVLTSSCKIREKLVYFQDSSESIKSENKFELVLNYGDIIGVDVSAMDDESVKPFLRDVQSSVGGQSPSYNNGAAAKGGYLIDNDGCISMPIVGKLKVVGLNRTQATELITKELKEYISNPIVSIRLLNFKVTILGDVKLPGTYNIPNEKITLNEAIGLAGDLNITGLRDNILLIREEDGVKKKYRVDLTKDSILGSPLYFLRQNDVVYIEPNRAKRNSSLVSSTAGVFISISSLVITLITLISR